MCLPEYRPKHTIGDLSLHPLPRCSSMLASYFLLRTQAFPPSFRSPVKTRKYRQLYGYAYGLVDGLTDHRLLPIHDFFPVLRLFGLLNQKVELFALDTAELR